MILKDFLPGFVFRRGQDSDSQNSKILPLLRFLFIFYRKWPNAIFPSFENLNSVHVWKKSSTPKSLRTVKILLYLCFLDIILTLPSLPTHSSRGKMRLKTRRFSKFWEFSVFSIGNPIVMKIRVFSVGNQRIFMKISLNILLWLRHCYLGRFAPENPLHPSPSNLINLITPKKSML